MRLKNILFYIFIGILVLLVGALLINYRSDISVDDLKKKYANENSKFVDIEGVQVHYRDEGKGEVILLLHGTAASLHTWDVWTETLKKDFRVIRLDLPAFGLTGPNQKHDYTLNYYLNFLNQFLKKLKIDSCNIAGNSLGGHLSWEYALKYPTQIKKMILIDPAGYPTARKIPWVFRLAQTPVVNQIVRNITPKFLFKNNLLQVYADDSKITEDLVNRYYELGLRTGNRDAFIARANTKPETNYKQLPQIKTPTLIQWGKEDSWIPVTLAQNFKNDMPNAQVRIYENAGHVPMEEISEITVKDARLFLKDK